MWKRQDWITGPLAFERQKQTHPVPQPHSSWIPWAEHLSSGSSNRILGRLFISLHRIKLLLFGSWLLKHPVCPYHLHIPITHCHFPANEPCTCVKSFWPRACDLGGLTELVTDGAPHGVFGQGVPGLFSHLLLVLVDQTFVPHCPPPQTSRYSVYLSDKKESSMPTEVLRVRSATIRGTLCP